MKDSPFIGDKSSGKVYEILNGKMQEIGQFGSGNTEQSDWTKNGGPTPDGEYGIYSRNGGENYSGGRKAYLLDPIDSKPFNDTWDNGLAKNRPGAFRFHIGDANVKNVSLGCCVTPDYKAYDKLIRTLESYKGGPTRTIIQPSKLNKPSTFTDENYFGRLKVQQ